MEKIQPVPQQVNQAQGSSVSKKEHGINIAEYSLKICAVNSKRNHPRR